ncbi:MAG: pentapeptide repeat-containing protein [Arenicellales bacterium WSBS_2016_MAG_OTU3]
MWTSSLFRRWISQTLWESANLNGANLGDTNLSDANLSNANLSSANLSDANLSDADFNNATFSSDTTFTNAWAWADEPPLNLPATIQIQLCKYNNTEGSSRHPPPDSCIRRIPSKRDNQQSHSVPRPLPASVVCTPA